MDPSNTPADAPPPGPHRTFSGWWFVVVLVLMIVVTAGFVVYYGQWKGRIAVPPEDGPPAKQQKTGG
jgi:hypothetical protein